MDFECHCALIGLGSNQSGPLGQPADYIEAALLRLDESDGLGLINRSRLYQSAPWGNQDQAQFVNAVAQVHYHSGAEDLLETLLGIEDDLGRERDEKWGPRLIDLDLLCFDDLQYTSEKLLVPHPHMHERAFVLVPVLELDPDFIIPGRGRADDCLAALEDDQSVELL